MKILIKAAMDAMKMAYAPYSKFKVGAALEDRKGRIFTGCNVENASYGLDICAERSAVCKAVSEGSKTFKRIAIATTSKRFSTPCGACRQVLEEFSPRMEIILVNKEGRTHKFKLSKLFPNPFRLK